MSFSSGPVAQIIFIISVDTTGQAGQTINTKILNLQWAMAHFPNKNKEFWKSDSITHYFNDHKAYVRMHFLFHICATTSQQIHNSHQAIKCGTGFVSPEDDEPTPAAVTERSACSL